MFYISEAECLPITHIFLHATVLKSARLLINFTISGIG